MASDGSYWPAGDRCVRQSIKDEVARLTADKWSRCRSVAVTRCLTCRWDEMGESLRESVRPDIDSCRHFLYCSASKWPNRRARCLEWAVNLTQLITRPTIKRPHCALRSVCLFVPSGLVTVSRSRVKVTMWTCRCLFFCPIDTYKVVESSNLVYEKCNRRCHFEATRWLAMPHKTQAQDRDTDE